MATRFPDVAVVVAQALVDGGFVAAGRAGTYTPPDLQDVLPWARVLRVAGGSDRLNDASTVDVDVFAGTYVGGELLAERIRQYLCGPPPPTPLLDRIDCTGGPRELPWDDSGTVRRFGVSFVVVARRTVALA